MNVQQPTSLQPPSLQQAQLNSPGLVNKQPKSPAVSTNLTKININNNTQKAPMGSERNINNTSNVQQPQQYQPHGLQRTNSTNLNAAKGFLQDRMDIEDPHIMTNSQVHRQNNNFMQNNSQLANSQYYNVNGQNIRQDNYQFQQQQAQQPQQFNHYQTNYQNPPNTNQYQQPVQNPRMGLGQQFHDGGDRLNQYRTNYQQPDQRQQSLSAR